MFAPDQIGKVNAAPVGGYAAECLLVVGPNHARSIEHGWNVAEGCDRNFYRIADAGGKPMFPCARIAPTDLMSVCIEKYERPALPFVPRLPRALLVLQHDGETYTGEPEGDAPHIVEEPGNG